MLERTKWEEMSVLVQIVDRDSAEVPSMVFFACIGYGLSCTSDLMITFDYKYKSNAVKSVVEAFNLPISVSSCSHLLTH